MVGPSTPEDTLNLRSVELGRNPFALATNTFSIEHPIVASDVDRAILVHLMSAEKEKRILLYGNSQTGKSQCAWLAAQEYVRAFEPGNQKVAMINLHGDSCSFAGDAAKDSYIDQKINDLLESGGTKKLEDIAVIILDEISAWGDSKQIEKLLTKLESKLPLRNRKTQIIAITTYDGFVKLKQDNPFTISMEKHGFARNQISTFMQEMFVTAGLDFDKSGFGQQLITWIVDMAKNNIADAQKIGQRVFEVICDHKGKSLDLGTLKLKVLEKLEMIQQQP